MLFDRKPINTIDKADLDALVEREVRELRDVEYKSRLPGRSDSERKEFLADVSSFANGHGGYLIYGVLESGGLPQSVDGVAIADVDAEILSMESSIRDGVAPRILGVQVQPVPVGDDMHVLVVRVPRSWAQPHMVTYKGTSRFYGRNSAGKYPLDVGEIRSAFVLSESAPQRVRDFRAQRLNKLLAGDAPVTLPDGPLMVLHSVPLSAAGGVSSHVPLAGLSDGQTELRPMSASRLGGWGGRHNFDGYVVSATRDESYVQVFRDGSIEAVDGRVLSGSVEDGIPSMYFEKEIIDALTAYLRFQAGLGLAPPFVVMLSLLGVQGRVMALSQDKYWRDTQHPIDRDHLIVPDVLAAGSDVDVPKLIRPALDAIWNAVGLPGSIHYDESGAWCPPR